MYRYNYIYIYVTLLYFKTYVGYHDDASGYLDDPEKWTIETSRDSVFHRDWSLVGFCHLLSFWGVAIMFLGSLQYKHRRGLEITDWITSIVSVDDPPCIVSVQFGLLIDADRCWLVIWFFPPARTNPIDDSHAVQGQLKPMALSRNRGCTLTGVLDNLLYVYAISIRRKNYIHLFIHPFALIYILLLGATRSNPV